MKTRLFNCCWLRTEVTLCLGPTSKWFFTLSCAHEWEVVIWTPVIVGITCMKCLTTLTSAVSLPVASLTDPPGGPQPQPQPQSLWDGPDVRVPDVPPQPQFRVSFCPHSVFSCLFCPIAIIFFFSSDGFSLVPIHGRIVYFCSGPVITHFLMLLFFNFVFVARGKEKQLQHEKSKSTFLRQTLCVSLAPRKRADKRAQSELWKLNSGEANKWFHYVI